MNPRRLQGLNRAVNQSPLELILVQTCNNNNLKQFDFNIHTHFNLVTLNQQSQLEKNQLHTVKTTIKGPV